MTIPEESTSTRIQSGDGDDGAASGGDAGEAVEQVAAPETTGDGADGQDVGQAAPESSPDLEALAGETPLLDSLAASGQKLGYQPPEVTNLGEANQQDVLVEVPIGADGGGSALSGLDPDYVASARILNGEGDVSFEPAHTVAITRVTVTRSNFAEGGTALVALTPK